jgi:AraC-like DNA-binding protein
MPAVQSSDNDTDVGRPCERLQPYIARYAGIRIRSSRPVVTRALPSRYVTLIVGLGSSFRIAHSATFGAFVAGLGDAPTIVESGAALEGVHVFLNPLGTKALLDVPSSALAGDVVDLHDVAGSRAGELQESLQAVPSWPERFAVLDRVFCDLLTERRVLPEIDWAWQTIMRDAGGSRIESLAERIGWSRRHFTQRFRTELGVTPKTVARIARFEQTCAMFKRGRTALADTAMAAGYHDQSHMAREWQALAGCTPRAWIAEELPFIQEYELAGLE